MTSKKKAKAESEGKAAAKVSSGAQASPKVKIFYSPICITHTTLSSKNKVNNGAAQHHHIQRLLTDRGCNIKDHDIHVLELGPRPDLNEEIENWISDNPKGATFRNGIFTPCARILDGWKGRKVTKVTKPVTK